MRKFALALILGLLFSQHAWAAAGLTTIDVKDAGGTTRTFTVLSTTGAVTGGLSSTQVICDPTTPTQCAAVSSGGAVTVSPVGTAQGASTSGVTGSLVLCATTTSITGGTTATVNGFNCTPAGALRIDNSTVAGTAIDTNSGTKSAGTQRVVLATDQPALTNPLLVNIQAVTSGGWSLSSTLTPNNTTAVVVKASAGQIGKIVAFNNSATIAYLKIYNATSATCGSGTPVDRILIPASTSGAGVSIPDAVGDAYSTGITYCVTTGYADNDTTAPAANAYVVNIHYK